MATILVSHRRLFFEHCPWCSAFSRRFVDCCFLTALPPSLFSKSSGCCWLDVAVVAVIWMWRLLLLQLWAEKWRLWLFWVLATVGASKRHFFIRDGTFGSSSYYEIAFGWLLCLLFRMRQLLRFWWTSQYDSWL